MPSIVDLQRGAEVIDVDERVIAVAPELRALVGETSGFRQRLDAIASAENSADDIERRIAAGPAIPQDAQDSAENRAAVEAWRDRLAALQADVAAAERAAAASSASAAGAESVAETPVAQAAPQDGRCRSRSRASPSRLGVIFLAAGLLIAPPQTLVSVLGAAVAVTRRRGTRARAPARRLVVPGVAADRRCCAAACGCRGRAGACRDRRFTSLPRRRRSGVRGLPSAPSTRTETTRPPSVSSSTRSRTVTPWRRRPPTTAPWLPASGQGGGLGTAPRRPGAEVR